MDAGPYAFEWASAVAITLVKEQALALLSDVFDRPPFLRPLDDDRADVGRPCDGGRVAELVGDHH